MCGIIGILGVDDVAERLVEGLRRLEYRGYDSAGICTVHDGDFDRRRAPAGRDPGRSHRRLRHDGTAVGCQDHAGDIRLIPRHAKSFPGTRGAAGRTAPSQGHDGR